jgi:hypothetical protein
LAEEPRVGNDTALDPADAGGSELIGPALEHADGACPSAAVD